MGRVAVLGSINLDVVVTAPRHPLPRETLMGTSIDYLPGGKGCNQAVAAARSGAPSLLVGVVGDDGGGARLRDFLSGAGVELTHVRRVRDMPTGTAVVVVGGGESAVVVVTGANAALGPEDAGRVEIARDDVLVSQFETARDATAAFFSGGRSAGARTILNPSPVDVLSQDLLEITDVIVVNELELEQLSGGRPIDDSLEAVIEEARLCRVRDDQSIVVTLGARGCLVLDRRGVTTIEGRPATPVDATGAGDCFLGFMAGELSRGSDLRHAAEVANVAASLSVRTRGAAPSIPTAQEVVAASG